MHAKQAAGAIRRRLTDVSSGALRRALAAQALAGLLAAGSAEAQTPATRDVTFTRDIAPILQRSCQSCHRPDSLAPMSLITYEEVRPYARAIKQRTTLRNRHGVMPPWFIEKEVGIQQFKDDISLTDEEIARIARWADSGAPRGNPADMPVPLAFAASDVWQIGAPDLVVSTPAVEMKAVSPDWWGALDAVPTGLAEDRYIAAIEIKEVNDSRRGEDLPVRRRGGAAAAAGHHSARDRILRQHVGQPQRGRSEELVRPRPSFDRQHDDPDLAGDLSDRRSVRAGDRRAPQAARPRSRRDRPRLSAVRVQPAARAAADGGSAAAMTRPRTGVAAGAICAATIAATVLLFDAAPSGQTGARSGLSVAPVYEGWERNADGSFNLVFGYMNRNWDETFDAPIGPGNRIEPGGPDRGQPTHFLPRRNQLLFRVRVPADFGTQELVWTLTTQGKTERAYGTLKPDYVVDSTVIMANYGAGGQLGTTPDLAGNVAPVLELMGEPERRVRAGEAVELTAVATDDGKPRTRAMPPVVGASRMLPMSATGLRLAWFKYRGAGGVRFDPPQFTVWEDTRDGANSPWAAGWKTPPVPPANRWQVRATIDEPGEYVLRCVAHDGGLATMADVRVMVR